VASFLPGPEPPSDFPAQEAGRHHLFEQWHRRLRRLEVLAVEASEDLDRDVESDEVDELERPDGMPTLSAAPNFSGQRGFFMQGRQPARRHRVRVPRPARPIRVRNLPISSPS
jgi:hypothetical protein